MTTRTKMMALFLATALATPLLAQSVPVPVAAPATQPTPAIPAAPATPTVISAAPATPAAVQSRVLVIPFNTLNLTFDQKWIAKGVQEALVADLGKSSTYTPMGFEGQTIVEDNATAVRLAKEAGVPYALRGAAQVMNGEVRLTAQLLDAKTGDTVSTAISTGPMNNLLRLEDDVALQLHLVPVVAQAAAPAAQTAAAPQPLAPAYATPQPAYTPAQPVYNQPPVYAPPVYPPEDVYPDYDYPVYSPPIYYYPSGGVFFGGGPRFIPNRGIPGGSRFGGGGNFGHVGGGFSGGHSGGGFSGGHGGGGHR